MQNSRRDPVHESFGKLSLRVPLKDCMWSLNVLVLFTRAWRALPAVRVLYSAWAELE